MGIRQIKQTAAAAILIVGMVACADSDISSFPSAEAGLAGADAPIVIDGSGPSAGGAPDMPVTTLDLHNALHEQRLTGADKLPSSTLIPRTNFNGVPVTAALQSVLSGTDISLTWNAAELRKRPVSIANLSGPLPTVVEKICAAAKLFCDYRHGSLELSERESFVVALPPITRAVSGGTGASDGMVEAINQLLRGDKAQIDDQGGNIIYTTTVEGEERVSQYLRQLRAGRPLIVLQMYIWDVALNQENVQGINWNQFQSNAIHTTGSGDNTPSLASTTGGVSIGAVTSGAIAPDTVLGFLSTRGHVRTISNPQVIFVSGAKSEVKVGGTQRYISQVGANASNANGISGGNTIHTDSIDTGLTINIAGSYENGLVFATLELALKNLIGLNPTITSGETIDLPQTSDEKMSTVLRVRPGDSLILAGLVSSTDNGKEAPPLAAPTPAASLPVTDRYATHELVMIVKPSIVLFSDQATDQPKQENADAFPEPVVIDKDGSHAIEQGAPFTPLTQAFPSESPVKLPPPISPTPSMRQSALSSPPSDDSQSLSLSQALLAMPPVSTPTTDVGEIISVAPGTDAVTPPPPAPVDRSLMQNGFSQALDRLKQNKTSKNPTGNGL